MNATATIATLVPTGTWKTDAVHSTVGFSVKHMGVSTVRGQFTDYDGTLEIAADGTATAHGTVKSASVNTNEPQRDEHLRSPDFFDAVTYPELTFSSTSITPDGEDTFKILGQLTIHGVTQDVELDAEVTGSDVDPQGNTRVGLEITGELSRKDFDMKFNAALGSGNLVVSDKVKLALDISAVKQA
jgi:polyisoprenoid-binding protein YceI